MDHRSCIAIPMIVGDDVIGVLLVFHRKVNHFNTDMQNLVKAIASQVAVAINNAHLYELIRDQAERLGVMLRKEQEDASRSQAILAAVADGVLVTSANNQISFINPSIESILHVERSKLLGSSLDSFAGLFGKSSGAWMTTIHRWSEEPSIYQPGDTYAEQLELEDGRIVLVHLAPVIMENEFLGTVSIFSDITQQVEVDRMKPVRVTVSHELRTPMTSIKGYVDLLQMGAAGALNDNQEHFVDIVSNNINRLNMLLDELLDISRFEAGHVIITPAAVNLVHLAEEAVIKIKQRSEKENKPMTIKLGIEEDLPQILGDAQHMRSILSHLLDNAYNYTPENGIISLQIRTGEEDDVQVDIKDNGIGIPTTNQEQVFERFWRGEDERVLATPGTGLGSHCPSITEMHKGKI
jgi:signal transduction histidine kinase